MHFREEYFKKEVKDGYEVSSLMKRCWAAQMEVLEQFDEICRKLGIKYYAAYGTLLGAVRHKGFIPWDDDIDIWLLREDMERFLKETKESLVEKGLELVTPYSDRDYHNLCFRVINTRQSRVDQDFLMKYWMFPFMAGVDLMPLDYVPRRENDRELLRTLYLSANKLGIHWHNKAVSMEEKLETYQQLAELIGVPMVEESAVEAHLWKLSDRIGAMYTAKDADQVATLVFYYKNSRKIFDKKWFEKTVYMDFEGFKIPCPSGYKEVLSAEFGDDYMTPVRVYETHEFPYYRKWHELLKKNFEESGLAMPTIWKDI